MKIFGFEYLHGYVTHKAIQNEDTYQYFLSRTLFVPSLHAISKDIVRMAARGTTAPTEICNGLHPS